VWWSIQGFGDEEDFYNQMYLGGQGGQSTMFPGQQQQQQQPPQQQPQPPPSQQKDVSGLYSSLCCHLSYCHFPPQAVAHNVYTPTGPGPAAVGGVSSQNMMYSSGGEYKQP